MIPRNTKPAIAILPAVLAGCVTYTPVSVPSLPISKAQACPRQEPIPVPPGIPNTVRITITPDADPSVDEGGEQLIQAYAEAQRNIKKHNKTLTNR